MGCLPYFKFYPADWLADRRVRRLSPAARALYWDLLAVAWNEDGIPADLEELEADMATLGYPRRAFRTCWVEVEKFFIHGRKGVLVNPRQEEEREKATAIYESRVAAGRKGGRPVANGGRA